MKKLLKNKKAMAIIIGAIAVVIISVASVYAVNTYNEYQRTQKIEASINEINEHYDEFQKETDRAKKLEILKSLEKEYDVYTEATNDECFEEVQDKYEYYIDLMETYFKEEYDKSIENYTLEKLDKIDDKDKISNYKKKLESLYTTIKNEENIVCSNKEVKSYKEKIDKLIDSYDERIKEIKEAEEAAAKAKAEKEAEEKRKAAEEAAAKAAEESVNDQTSDYNYSDSNNYDSSTSYSNNNNSSSSSNSSSTNNDSNSSASNNNNNNNDTYEVWSYTNEDGYTTYSDNNGKVWDDNGVIYQITDEDEWFRP